MVNFENNYERPVSNEAGQLNVFAIYVQSYGKGIFNWGVDQTEHYSPALMKGMINIAVNEGKRFEQNWKNSCEKYPNIWIYRLKDNAASFGGGNNTRFASHKQNQIDELSDAGKHNLVAGFLINFRNKNNDTYFIEIRDFNQMLLTLNKKSFNIKDLERNNAIYVDSECKKVNHVYEVKKFISETHL